ncbi:MAG: hypothetical protein M1308_17955 [Actinobacteria bacterium]|nr:hypothetical protein [Actinomycetota bacterium]
MKKHISKYFLIVVLILIVVFFIYPSLILGDSSKSGFGSQVANAAVDPLTAGTSLSKFDDNFILILIVSVIIVGILLFAIWQIFKSKRQF